MKQDKFLWGIIAGIVIVAILAIVFYFVRRADAALLPPTDTPEGVVSAYVQAVQEQDWERAYPFLADAPNRPDLSRFRRAGIEELSSQRNAGLEITGSRVTGDQAEVDVVVVNVNGGLFADVYRNPGVAILERQGGEWKIREMPYPFWSYNWYPPDNLPTKP